MFERLLSEEGGEPARFEVVLEGEKNTDTRSKQDYDERLLIETLGRDKVQIDND